MNHHDVDEFVDKVDEVSRLIAGLKEGTISPSYVENKCEETAKKAAVQKAEAEKKSKEKEITPERKEELMKKVKELKDRHARKERARHRLSQYIEEQPQSAVTDYHKWDLWVPSDDDDDLISSCTPNTPEFKAMEKDIDERHERMVRQRQIAQREKEAGNAAYKKGQVTEAYRCYSTGLDNERHNMELHANAAMASIKMGCHVQALEHCDKVLHIADALHDNPNHPLCIKALQRRAVANKALKRYKESVNDLSRAVRINPSNKEVGSQLKKAEQDLEEREKEKSLANQVDSCDGNSDKVQRLKKVEGIVQDLRKNCGTLQDSTNKSKSTPIGLKSPLPKKLVTKNKDKARTRFEDLNELLQIDDDCRVYFRGCGGFDIIEARMEDNIVEVEVEELIGLLRVIQSAIHNRGNLEIAAGGRIISRVVDLFADMHHASVDLRHQLLSLLEALSVDNIGRKALAEELVDCRDGSSGFAKLIDIMGTGTKKQKVSILSILSRCTLEASIRSLMRSRRNALSKMVTKMEAAFQSKETLQVELCALLLSNICCDERLRIQLAEDAPLVESLVRVVIDRRGLSESSVKTCTAALANCLVEPAAERCTSQWHSEIVSALSASLSTNNQCTIASATLALSRLAKCGNALSMFEQPGIFTKMVSLLNRTRPSELQHKIEDGIVRTVAAFSTLGTGEVDHLVQCGVVPAMLKLLTCGNRNGSTYGNVSLFLSNIAARPEHVALLKKEDCIKALVDVAHKSEPGSRRNAAIALARIAQDPSCLDIVRKFHGFEVMYSYVKP